jgi:hypothetical protein
MPKLPASEAEAVEEFEGGEFEALPDNLYVGRLREVTVGAGPKGPYWTWVYEIPEDYEYAGRRFWNTTSLSEAARFKMKESFDAFGVPAGTDTDELCGQLVVLQVGHRVIPTGARAGQLQNQVEAVLPYSEEEAEEDLV